VQQDESLAAESPATLPLAGPRQRRERLRAWVSEQGFVRIEDLAQHFHVSIMTIHRDLEALQAEGWLRKVRGGATAKPSSLYHGDVRHRSQTMAAQKFQLAKAALDEVRPGASIMLDDSTTALALAELLPGRGPCTVITNFFAVMKVLAGAPDIDLISLGGAYYPAYDAFLGMRTSESVRSLHADVLFMSTTAVTDGDCFHQSLETVAVKRSLMESADRRVLLIDHSKFTKSGVYRLARLNEFEQVLVDSGITEDQLASLRRHDVPFRVVEADQTEAPTA
jgi:DeoR/GlpR family transcriptional regulator of sugar metabolism